MSHSNLLRDVVHDMSTNTNFDFKPIILLSVLFCVHVATLAVMQNMYLLMELKLLTSN